MKRMPSWLKHHIKPLIFIIFAACCLIWLVTVGIGQNFPGFRYFCYFTSALAAAIVLDALMMLLFKRYKLDRYISNANFPSAISVILTIVAVPVMIFGIVAICNSHNADKLTAEELVYEDALYGNRGGTSHNPISDNSHRDKADNGKPGLMWAILYHFTDPGNQHMSTSSQGRWWALIIGLLGAGLMSGVLVSTITNMLDRRADQWSKGECRYKASASGFCSHYRLRCFERLWYRIFFGRYVAIIGSHDAVYEICTSIFNDKKKHIDNIFILTTTDVPRLRNRLKSHKEIDESRIIIYSGERDNADNIRDLNPDHAEEIYILGESGDEPQHDIQNMACLDLVADILSKRRDAAKTEPCKCHVLFEYQTAFSVLQSSRSKGIVKDVLEFIPLSYYENWAQKVLITNADSRTVRKSAKESRDDRLARFHALLTPDNNGSKSYNYAPIDGWGIGYDSDKTVHLVIAGMSKMGVALAIEAAHIAHYPNFVRDKRLRTRITFIDPAADSEMDFFMSRYKHLFALSRWRYAESKGRGGGSYFANDATRGNDIFTDDNWNEPLDPASPTYNPEIYRGCDESVDKTGFLDIEWEFVKGGVETPDVQRYLTRRADDDSVLLTVAICDPEEHQAVASALYLPLEVYRKSLQVLVYQRKGSAVIDNITGRDSVSSPFRNEKRDKNMSAEETAMADADEYLKNIRYKRLRPFGMLDSGDACTGPRSSVPYKVGIIYDAIGLDREEDEQEKWKNTPLEYLAGCCENVPKDVKPWKELAIWAKWSNIYNANSIPTKMRSMAASGLDPVNPFGAIARYVRGGEWKLTYHAGASDAEAVNLRDVMRDPDGMTNAHELRMLYTMAAVEHNRWAVERLLMGYRAITGKEFDIMYKVQADGTLKAAKEKRSYMNQSKALSWHYKEDLNRAHHCICSFAEVYRIDPGTIDYDVAFTLMIPYLSRQNGKS